MKTPEDKTLCLAHNPYRWPHTGRLPPTWCERLKDCARHQLINQVLPDNRIVVQPRVCTLGTHDAFIDRDAVDSEGGAA